MKNRKMLIILAYAEIVLLAILFYTIARNSTIVSEIDKKWKIVLIVLIGIVGALYTLNKIKDLIVNKIAKNSNNSLIERENGVCIKRIGDEKKDWRNQTIELAKYIESYGYLIRDIDKKRITLLASTNYSEHRSSNIYSFCLDQNQNVAVAEVLLKKGLVYIKRSRAEHQVRVNGKMIEPEREILLHDKDRITIINSEYTFYKPREKMIHEDSWAG